MNYIGVSELKQTKRMWEMLDSEGELVLTKEGKPGDFGGDPRDFGIHRAINPAGAFFRCCGADAFAVSRIE
jgi:hypothetical protein